MILPEAPPVKHSAVPAAETEETILYRWALARAGRNALEAEGWRVVALHPVYGTSALMRFDG